MSRQDVADLTGATVHTVSRTLSDWGRRDLIRSSRGQITVTKPHELAAIAELAD